MIDRVVLAYSGGLASTAAIPWLQERHGAEVVAVVVGFGQRGELGGIRDQALASGAVRCHVLDMETAFARELVWPTVRGQVDAGLPPSWLMTPLIARSVAQVARMEHAGTVAHGAIDADAARFAAALRDLDPGLVVVPTLAHESADRRTLDTFLHERGLTAPAVGEWTAESTLWGRAVVGPALRDSSRSAPEEIYALTRHQPPLAAATLEIWFERGWPVAVNGVRMALSDLFDSVATIAGAHGVGRSDVVTVDASERPRREVRETPALTVLREAHAAVQQMTGAAGSDAFAWTIGREYATLLRTGRWFSPARRGLDAYVDAVQADVSGVARLLLADGSSRLIGRRLGQFDTEAACAAVP